MKKSGGINLLFVAATALIILAGGGSIPLDALRVGAYATVFEEDEEINPNHHVHNQASSIYYCHICAR